MKKLPKVELKSLITPALGVSVLGFCLMMTDTLMDIGAVLFALGLLPLAVVLARTQE